MGDFAGSYAFDRLESIENDVVRGRGLVDAERRAERVLGHLQGFLNLAHCNEMQQKANWKPGGFRFLRWDSFEGGGQYSKGIYLCMQ